MFVKDMSCNGIPNRMPSSIAFQVLSSVRIYALCYGLFLCADLVNLLQPLDWLRREDE